MIKEVAKSKVKDIGKKAFKKILIKLGFAKIGAIFLAVVGFLLGIIILFMGLTVVVAGHAAENVNKVMKGQDVSCETLQVAYDEHMKNRDIDFIGLLAYNTSYLEGKEDRSDGKVIKFAASNLKNGVKIEDLIRGKDQKEMYNFIYPMYESAYSHLLGEYDVEKDEMAEQNVSKVEGQTLLYLVTVDGEECYKSVADIVKLTGEGKEVVYKTTTVPTTTTKKVYGVKDFYPFAQGFAYKHYNDFGDNRSYKYERTHEGNDIMADEKTPIVAVESGVIEKIGWNELGGYRIGIRSFDKKRYYYYAHMFAVHPYVDGLAEGKVVNAGDVIGFVGATGYSKVEGTTGKFAPHLHIQIEVTYKIGDEEMQACIDPYSMLKFIEGKNKAKLIKVSDFQYNRNKKQ